MSGEGQEKLQLLLDACLLLSSKLELPELLRTILELASRVVGAETASLLLLDPESRELYFHTALGLDPEAGRLRLKLGEGVAGVVARDGKPVVINDAPSDPRWSSAVDRRSGFVTRSLLAAPMTIKGKVIGVVEVINREQGPFSFLDLRVFEAFAAQAAIAIDNARLFASLRDEKYKLDTVFSQMKDAAVLTDAKGRVLLLNASARAFFPLDAGGRAGIQEGLAAVSVTPPLPELLESREPAAAFEAVRSSPKKLFLAGTACSLRFDGAQGTPAWSGKLFVFRDVTEERREELLKRSFLSLISHKLKTPLSSITGYAQILLDEPALGRDHPDARKGLQVMLAQGKKLSGLVDKLLRFVTIEGLDPAALPRRPFSVDEAVAEAVRSLEGWLQEQGARVRVGPACGARALGDPELVREALRHLIENGVKFNPARSKSVSVRAQAKDGSVELRVEDDGPGIPPEDRERVLSRFYQVEDSFTGQVEGWGLGLPFVKKVAECHGGRLSLDSRVPGGTAVSFSLPRSDHG